MQLPEKFIPKYLIPLTPEQEAINEIITYLEAKEKADNEIISKLTNFLLDNSPKENFHSETPILSRDEECKQILNQKWETDSETKLVPLATHPCSCDTRMMSVSTPNPMNGTVHSETKEPMFTAEELEDDQIYESEDGKWILQAVYYKEFETEEAAREALLKLTN